MKTYNLPASWDRMSFINRQYYLCNTHQAKNLSVAAKIITKMTSAKLTAAIKEAVAPKPQRLWYRNEN